MNATNTNNCLTMKKTLSDRCVQSCKKLLAGIGAVRNRIANEFHATFEANEQLVQLAMNEAEALAWQTPYPHLLFPALALEKVQSVAIWQTRQQALHQRRSTFAVAA
jgi:hypothetical protein